MTELSIGRRIRPKLGLSSGETKACDELENKTPALSFVGALFFSYISAFLLKV